MKIISSIQLNLHKLKRTKKKAAFLMTPIVVLSALLIGGVSVLGNINQAADEAIFGTVESQNKVLQIEKKQSSGFQAVGSGGFGEDKPYTANDAATLKKIENVDSAEITKPLGYQIRATTDDLSEGKQVELTGSLHGISEDFAKQYTNEDFSYNKDTKVIPIILNKSTFNRNYLDWQGKDSFEQKFSEIIDSEISEGDTPSDEDLEDIEKKYEKNSPFRSEIVAADTDTLRDSTIQINFGGLESVQTFKQEFTNDGDKISRLSNEDIANEEKKRQDAIGKHWDYEKIKAPIGYTFKVVGVTDGSSNENANFVPAEFIAKIKEDYIKNQLEARKNTTIAKSELNSTYFDMTFDGVELKESYGEDGGIFTGNPTNLNDRDPSYRVPGLVIETKRQTKNENSSSNGLVDGGSSAAGDVVGEYSKADVFTKVPTTSRKILVRINDVANRKEIVKSINDAGYSYSDVSDLEIFETIEDTQQKASFWLAAGFMAISGLIILITLGKFVSESRREIGVFRAVGMRARSIRTLFVSQAMVYVAIAYAIGLLMGWILVITTSSIVAKWFDRFVSDTIREEYGVANEIDSTVFLGISLTQALIFFVVLLLVTIIVSVIPAHRAAKISPVEAIRSE